MCSSLKLEKIAIVITLFSLLVEKAFAYLDSISSDSGFPIPPHRNLGILTIKKINGKFLPLHWPKYASISPAQGSLEGHFCPTALNFRS